MGATLTGAKLFGAKGYVAVRRIEMPLVNGEIAAGDSYGEECEIGTDPVEFAKNREIVPGFDAGGTLQARRDR